MASCAVKQLCRVCANYWLCHTCDLIEYTVLNCQNRILATQSKLLAYKQQEVILNIDN